jgi:mRNA interferase RelE/StbE
MSFHVTWEQDAADALDKLDPTIISRIIVRISWLMNNFDNIKPQALTGTLKGYFKLRSGHYRIIYTVNHRENEIVIEYIGHRRDIYKLS